MNILILSVGRRVELVKLFKDTAKKMNIKSNIIGADLSNTAPAIYFCDNFYLIPRIGTDNYIESIIEICKKENIKLIVPTIDTELEIMSKNKNIIESQTGAKVLISDESVINVCRNKINTQAFFDENNLGAPKIVNEECIKNKNYKFPLIIKPLDGSSSINVFKLYSEKELNFFKEYVKNPIIQELIEGTEFTVDVFCDFNSKPITIVPRQRIATRSGEISKGKIVKDRIIIEDVKKLLAILKPIGHITIQCIKTKDDQIKYIEINPRFGGGAPMSIKAGANSCANLYKLLQGETLEYDEDYKDNLIFLRFDDSIMLNENMELIND